MARAWPRHGRLRDRWSPAGAVCLATMDGGQRAPRACERRHRGLLDGMCPLSCHGQRLQPRVATGMQVHQEGAPRSLPLPRRSPMVQASTARPRRLPWEQPMLCLQLLRQLQMACWSARRLAASSHPFPSGATATGAQLTSSSSYGERAPAAPCPSRPHTRTHADISCSLSARRSCGRSWGKGALFVVEPHDLGFDMSINQVTTRCLPPAPPTPPASFTRMCPLLTFSHCMR